MRTTTTFVRSLESLALKQSTKIILSLRLPQLEVTFERFKNVRGLVRDLDAATLN